MAPNADTDLRVGVGRMLGTSPAMRPIWDLLERLAATDTNVLVTGETGTGKDLFVRTLHERSRRRGGPIVTANCCASAESLLEDDLFGHEPGAFTGAVERRLGYFEAADGGTLFLNEIGEVPAALQTKLLGAIDDRRIHRLGGTRETGIDVRIVAATNADIRAKLRDGRLRLDLYYRLAGVRVDLPPLRGRRHDVLLLAQHFAAEFGTAAGRGSPRLSPEACSVLLRHDWPGNVRELRNCIQAAVALADGKGVQASDLRLDGVPGAAPEQAAAAKPASRASSEAARRRREFAAALASAGGNRTLAGRLMAVDRRTVQRAIARFGLDVPSDGPLRKRP